MKPSKVMGKNPVTSTAAFRRWFGKSKVVGKDRKPLVVYHGSRRSGGFSAFDPKKSDDARALFFTDSLDLAASYGNREKMDPFPKHYIPPFETVSELRKFIASPLNDFHGTKLRLDIKAQYDEEAWASGEAHVYQTFDLSWQSPSWSFFTIAEGELTREGIAGLLAAANEAVSQGPGGSGVYAVYLKMENPLVVNGKGSLWNAIPFRGGYYKTRDIAYFAEREGYDGAIIKNIYDAFFVQDVGPANVFIVFDGRQVKSAYHNEGAFDPENPDIRKNPTLLDIPGVEAVVDTSKIRSSDDAYAFGNAAAYEDGVGVVAWHVTDDPTGILKKIERKTDFKKAYGDKRSELGPGLYVSAVPHIWTGRARNKWSFLASLTDDEKAAILALLHKDLARLVKRGYLSEAEHKYAMRLLDDAESANDLEYARALAGQPYNIKWSDPEWLAEASESAAMKATPPQAVKVTLRGRFAQLARSYPDPDVLRALRRAGFAGAFTRGGMGSNAELVVFHGSSLTPLAVETI